jgi:hypothetical protein
VLRLCQVIRPFPRLCVVIRNKYWILPGRVVSPPPNPQAGGPPTVSCPRLFIQYIRSYPPYLEAVSSIRNPRTRHAVLTVDSLIITHLHKYTRISHIPSFIPLISCKFHSVLFIITYVSNICDIYHSYSYKNYNIMRHYVFPWFYTSYLHSFPLSLPYTPSSLLFKFIFYSASLIPIQHHVPSLVTP